ncbi:hypothetical protein [Nonomuraea basaltis]|uniref:hypothetical protein n=1 Tax=Nonomuraea basaltis TaxID=2495887 RepID=UPI00110C5382|nr:hypothetical protein [Nonomuraea basaltis]TMR94714.1 hypothetical protein EJK15_32340 [Nonomuraea basaltis]
MTQDGALPLPPRPDDARTWEEYVAALRTLRLWAGARDDAELAGAVPGLTAGEVGEVLGERRKAVPDRRVSELIVRACLLMRERSEEEIAAERAVWRAAWDQVLAAGRQGRRPKGRAPAIAGGVLLPAVTGVVVNLATSNTRNPWAWGAVALVLVVHASLLAAGPVRWAREPVLAGIASVAAVTVTVGLVLALVPKVRTAGPALGPTPPTAAPVAVPQTHLPCVRDYAATYFSRPALDPESGRTWTVGYACENLPAPVHAGPDAATTQVGVLDQGDPRSIFFCVVRVGDTHWYRTAADKKWVGKGWGYVPQEYVRAAHPVRQLPACPR